MNVAGRGVVELLGELVDSVSSTGSASSRRRTTYALRHGHGRLGRRVGERLLLIHR
jgi:hypothetical protein